MTETEQMSKLAQLPHTFADDLDRISPLEALSQIDRMLTTLGVTWRDVDAVMADQDRQTLNAAALLAMLDEIRRTDNNTKTPGELHFVLRLEDEAHVGDVRLLLFEVVWLRSLYTLAQQRAAQRDAARKSKPHLVETEDD